MDDVPMFITRKLQPPTEVDIPVDLIQMFQVGSDRGNDSQVYDFTLEKYVCTKISEWVRNTEIDRMNRDERIRLKEIEKARQNEEKHKKLLTAVQYDELSSGEEDEEPQSQLDVEPEKKFSPTHISFDTILQPTIVPNQVNSSSAISSSCKLLNYSDFETIESSPFDNVELKTINDLDILAQILQNTNVHSTDSLKEVENKETNEEERTELEEKTVVEEPEPTPPVIINPPVFPPYYSNHHNGTHASVQNVHLIPDILKGLNNEILQSESRRSQSTDRGKNTMDLLVVVYCSLYLFHEKLIDNRVIMIRSCIFYPCLQKLY